MSERPLWIIATGVSLALHAGGVSAALMIAERLPPPEPATTLEIVSLPTSKAAHALAPVLAGTAAQRLTASAALPAAEQAGAQRLAALEPEAAKHAAPQTLAATTDTRMAAPAAQDRLDAAAPATRTEAITPAAAHAKPPTAAELRAAEPSGTVQAEAPMAAAAARPRQEQAAAIPAPTATASATSSEQRAPVADTARIAAADIPQRAAASNASAALAAPAGAAQARTAAPSAAAAIPTAPVAAPLRQEQSAIPATASAPSGKRAPAADTARIAAANIPQRAAASSVGTASTAPADVAEERAATAAPAVSAAAAVATPPVAAVPIASAPVAAAPARPAPAPTLPPAPEPASSDTQLSEDESEAQTAMLVPNPGPATVAPEDAVQRAARYLRDTDTGWCMLMLPAAGPSGQLTLRGFADRAERASVFLTAFERATGIDTEIRAGLVSEAQCRALAFARNLPAYPAFGLTLRLASESVRNGSTLKGSVPDANGRPVHLLLVDDEGKVQNLDRHQTRNGPAVTFEAPMTLTGGPVATVQLVVALAGFGRLETIETLDGTEADRYFDALTEELARLGSVPDLAVAAFAIR